MYNELEQQGEIYSRTRIRRTPGEKKISTSYPNILPVQLVQKENPFCRKVRTNRVYVLSRVRLIRVLL